MIEIEPCGQPDDRQSAQNADDGANAHMDEEAGDKVDYQDLGLRIEAGGDDLDERYRQEDGDGIVGAGFDFQRRADAVAQLHVAGAQQEENRRRVGGGDGGAEQE